MSKRHANRALVFASGCIDSEAIQLFENYSDDLLVCVDGGVAHCLEAGWQPDLIIGDMDSVDPQILMSLDTNAIEKITFPVAKDASDLELALQQLVHRGIADVVLFGISGGRTDHMLFNWMLPVQQNWPFKMRLIDGMTDAHVVRATQPLSVSPGIGVTVSLLALDKVGGVSVEGLLYSLHKADLQPGSTFGLSNEVVDEQVSVSIDNGTLLVMINLQPLLA